MSKAFTKDNPDAPDDDEDIVLPALPAGTKNYMTPGGHGRLKAELEHLITVDRPEVTRVVSWAASNGDRSENGDYLYGKKRLAFMRARRASSTPLSSRSRSAPRGAERT